MKIWLDSVNISLIKKAKQMGLLFGITTNPTIIASSSLSLEANLEKLLSIQNGPVTVQVTTERAEEMIIQGEKLHAFSPRIIVKVPVTAAGLETIHQLSKQQISTMATVIFHPNQVLLAALAGADYAAPYLSRIERAGDPPFEVLQTMSQVLAQYHFKTKLLAASLKNAEQAKTCAEMGIDSVTLKDSVFNELTETHRLTVLGLEQFSLDWEDAKPSELLKINEKKD